MVDEVAPNPANHYKPVPMVDEIAPAPITIAFTCMLTKCLSYALTVTYRNVNCMYVCMCVCVTVCLVL